MKPEFGLKSQESLVVDQERLVNDELLTATSVMLPGMSNDVPITREIIVTLKGFNVNDEEFVATSKGKFSITKFSDPEAEEIVAIEVETDKGIVTFFLNDYIPGEGWKFPV